MKAIIFDLDGVVADTSAAHYRSWQRLADEEGYAFDEGRYRALLGRTREDSLDLLVRGAPLAIEQRRDMLARKQAYFAVELAQMGPDDALPGVVSLLDAARDAGLKIGLASSSRNARAVLAQLRLIDRFEVIADGGTVARPKPAPDIFLWTAAALNVEPTDCVVLEDSVAGVEAAIAARCHVVSIGHEPIATHHLASLQDVTLVMLGKET
jgi:beta-phosphoglucomutase